MTPGSVPAPPAARLADPATGPRVALRLVTTHEDRTRRLDVVVQGQTSALLEGGEQTLFSTERLWPVLREELPPLDALRAAPRGRLLHDAAEPGPTFVADCRAHVSLATLVATGPEPVAATEVALRSWLATETGLWSVTPTAEGGTRVLSAPEGALADHLVWDVSAAMEALVRGLEATS
ncbi:hypothetical protein [Nocardioides nanhaiensis]|uniref:Uncharacterized protein n=1 Tax=Nocardioides nanhaiensis TaxID=1476871 RepID=A0ABP8VT11_9ACTN